MEVDAGGGGEEARGAVESIHVLANRVRSLAGHVFLSPRHVNLFCGLLLASARTDSPIRRSCESVPEARFPSPERVHPLGECAPLAEERVPALTDGVFSFGEMLNLFREHVAAFA